MWNGRGGVVVGFLSQSFQYMRSVLMHSNQSDQPRFFRGVDCSAVDVIFLVLGRDVSTVTATVQANTTKGSSACAK